MKNKMPENDKYSPPKPDDKDIAHAVTRAGLGAIPIAGAATTELLNAIVTPSLERRRNEWMEKVGEGLRQLEEQKNIDLEKLQENDAFIDVVIKASHAAIKEKNEAKLELLRNAVLNTAISANVDDILRNILAELVETLDPIHIELLKHFQDLESRTGAEDFSFLIPELRGNPLLYEVIWKRLVDEGLLNQNHEIPEIDSKTIVAGITELGDELLKFIASPF